MQNLFTEIFTFIGMTTWILFVAYCVARIFGYVDLMFRIDRMDDDDPGL